jgi:hypothetical protein
MKEQVNEVIVYWLVVQVTGNTTSYWPTCLVSQTGENACVAEGLRHLNPGECPNLSEKRKEEARDDG